MNWGCREMEKRKYDREFKLEILRLVREGKEAIAQIARDFGIGESLVSGWKRAFREESEDPFLGKGNLRKDEACVR